MQKINILAPTVAILPYGVWVKTTLRESKNLQICVTSSIMNCPKCIKSFIGSVQEHLDFKTAVVISMFQ